MRKYRAVCDSCGELGPIRAYSSAASRDANWHDCPHAPDVKTRVTRTRRQPTVQVDPIEVERLARATARRYLATHRYLVRHFDDVLSEAYLGAVRALTTYRAGAGSSPTTYLQMRAEKTILDWERERSAITRHEWVKGIRTVEQLPAWRQRPVDLYVLLSSGEEAEVPLVDLRAARQNGQTELRIYMTKLLQGLDAREREVIYLHFWEDQTLLQIGHRLRVTESRVCQMKRAALIKMRGWIEADVCGDLESLEA